MYGLLKFPALASKLMRLRGIHYLKYLLNGYAVPKLTYDIFKRISPHKLLRIAQLLLLVSLLGISLIASIAGGPIGTVIAVGAILLLIGFLVLFPQAKKFSKIKQARRLLQVAPSASFTAWDAWPVAVQVRRAVESFSSKHPDKDVVLGSVDNDGRLKEAFGPLPGWVSVSEEEFVPRYRFPLDIVLRNGCVLIRKDFCGDRESFVREWYNLSRLMSQANVPAVHSVDESKTILYKNLISAQTLRDVLVKAGAKILSVHTEGDADLIGLSQEEKIVAVLERGTRLLKSCFQDSFFTVMEEQINAIHRTGIAKLSLTFGNVMIDKENQPWFVDLEGAEAYSSLNNPIFRWQRDQDRKKYNRIYNRQLLTEESVREALVGQQQKLGHWYAPIDFGNGLTVGGFWSVDSGSGRWEYLNSRVMSPLVAGKRVLDLGSNNGIMPLMMLRAGAREVLGLEISPEFIESAQLIHRIFEWRDMRRYCFTIYEANMLEILNKDWEKFDVITSLCTLYYLAHHEMVAIVRRAAELAPVLIVQANEHTRPTASDQKSEKSSLAYLKQTMEKNGFPNIEIHAPLGFSRPLLIGRR